MNVGRMMMSSFIPTFTLYQVIEKLVAKRLEEHMSEYSMYEPMQSAYKLVHSTETALVKINYDILSSLDAGKCTVLVSRGISLQRPLTLSAFSILLYI